MPKYISLLTWTWFNQTSLGTSKEFFLGLYLPLSFHIYANIDFDIVYLLKRKMRKEKRGKKRIWE